MDPNKLAELKTFEPANYIETAEDVIRHLELAFEDGTPQAITLALRDVARSEGLTALAKKTGLSRSGLYKSLSADGDPRLSTLHGVLDALGLRLSVVAKGAAA